MPLLHTTVILAMSADGKIAQFDRSPARFSSQADLAHLEFLVANADGVLFGGGTLRAYGTALSVRDRYLLERRQRQGLPPQPWQIVWSPSGNLDRTCRFFHQPIPRGLLTTTTGMAHWGQPEFDQVWTLPPTYTTWNWPWAMTCLQQTGIQNLAVLGGGYLVAELLAQNLVQELYLTICPVVLGGALSPTPVDGIGFPAAIAPQLELLSCQQVGHEVFLHYRVMSRVMSKDD